MYIFVNFYNRYLYKIQIASYLNQIISKLPQQYAQQEMLGYLQSQLFQDSKSKISIQILQQRLNDLYNDNRWMQKQLLEYEDKINKLPANMRRKIRQKHQDPTVWLTNCNYNTSQELLCPPPNQNIYSSAVSRKQLEERLQSLEEEQQQISYISKLSDIYIRCKKQSPLNIISEETLDDQNVDQRRLRIHHQKSVFQKQQLQGISQFLRYIQPYEQSGQQGQSLINQFVSNIKLHTSKKLVQKCQNLIHYGSSGNNQTVVIESYLIRNCRAIILGKQTSESFSDKNKKIINKFIQKLLGQIIYYDVSYQKIILMSTVSPQIKRPQSHQQVIIRNKKYFLPTQTDKHFQQIKLSLKQHLGRVEDLKGILYVNAEQQALEKYFDRVVDKFICEIKGNLQYVLPYLNIKSRKQIMNILTHGKGQVIQFEDLVLRLKFKGQDGEMFMNNLDAVFNKLIQLHSIEGRQDQGEVRKVLFNDINFQTLTNFFQLGISQASQSLLQTSSKAFMKLTNNFSSRGNWQKSNASANFSKINSKKIFNMIFFSVSTLIQKIDELTDKNPELFCNQIENFDYQQKANQWNTKLMIIRQNVRKKIHME